MKRLVAIFFLSVYLLSLTEFNQLVKLPALVEHFQQHRLKNTDLSILKFLDIHYFSDDTNDADYDQDMRLPFKSHQGYLTSMLTIFVPLTSVNNINKPVPTGINTYSNFQETDFNSSFLSFIWQPPKSC